MVGNGNKTEKWMNREAGGELCIIARSELTPAAASVTSDTATELLCSYNWTSDKKPTIYVPGSAALWTGGNLPEIVSPDSGRQFIDQDGFKVPKHPFESVFRALEVQRPDYRFDGIDCLINRNSLRKLLEFCNGIKPRASFRMNLYMVRNTLIVERSEKNTVEFASSSESPRYGHNFERAFTKYPKGLNNSTSHHRVLQYKLGDVNMAVRFEIKVDASHDLETGNKAKKATPLASRPQADLDRLSRDINTLSLRSGNHKTPELSTSSITVNQKGNGTHQSLTAEIKTGKKSVSMGKILPQMWFGRTTCLIKGVHEDGEFRKIDIEQIDLVRWETDARTQPALRKLAALIEQIKMIVATTSNRSAILMLHRHESDKLKIFKRSVERKPLPDDVIANFWKGDE